MRRPAVRLRERVRRAAELHAELFVAPWRAGLERETRRQRDLLVTLVCIEALGVENPMAWHTLDVYPELVQAHHDWHRRRGLDRSDVPGLCC